MTDIVKRLREYTENIRGKDEPPENYLAWQAADEIERLRELTANVPNLIAEIERLRGVLDEVLDECKDQYDVEDGDDGRPLPNRWMKLGNLIEEALR